MLGKSKEKVIKKESKSKKKILGLGKKRGDKKSLSSEINTNEEKNLNDEINADEAGDLNNPISTDELTVLYKEENEVKSAINEIYADEIKNINDKRNLDEEKNLHEEINSDEEKGLSSAEVSKKNKKLKKRYPNKKIILKVKVSPKDIVQRLKELFHPKSEEQQEGKKRTKSQVERFKKLTKESYIVIVIGVFMLIVFVIATGSMLIESRNESKISSYFNEYRMATKSLITEAQTYAVTGKITHYDNYMRELNTDKVREEAWNNLQKCKIEEEEVGRLNTINVIIQELLPYEEKAIALVQEKNLEEAISILHGDEYGGMIERLESMMDRCIESVERTSETKVLVSRIFMLVSGVCFTVLFFYILKNNLGTIRFSEQELLKPIMEASAHVVAISEGNFDGEIELIADDSEVGEMLQAIAFMKKNFSHMVMEISNILEQMAQGNYKVELKQEYVGEFIKIKDSMNMIISETVSTLSTIRNVAEEINCGSEQLAKAAEDLAEGGNVQSMRVSEIVRLVQSTYTSMENHVIDADATVKISTETAKVLMAGYEKMQNLKAAISNINDCSTKINKIILTIQDIADETNLLSLNAAIEAARAGESGRGFAVVAEQVKKLADESSRAAGETTKLIETTVSAVSQGMLIADETAKNMNSIIDSAKESTTRMHEMAVKLKEEALNMREINKNVEEVALIVDNNSATSQETAAVSEEQAAQVETMVDLLEQFKI